MKFGKNTIRIFIDESGTPDPFIKGKNQDHDRYFTLCAVLIKQDDYRKLKIDFEALCEKYRPYLADCEIKSNYIRCGNPKYVNKHGKKAKYSFHTDIQNGQAQYDSFCADIKLLIKNTDFKIISVSTNKEVAQLKYPNLKLHNTMLLDLWERISIFYAISKEPKMKIIFDRTKSYSDTVMKESFKLFKKKGSWYWDNERMKKLKLDKDVYTCKSEDSRGVQLADLCAYPIKKYAENPNHSFFKEVVKEKLHSRVIDKTTGKIINMGTKKSLN